MLILIGAGASVWGLSHYPPAARFLGIAPAAPPVTKEDLIKKLAAEGAMDMNQMTEAAKAAFQKKLSGAPVSASEVGQDALEQHAVLGEIEAVIRRPEATLQRCGLVALGGSRVQ